MEEVENFELEQEVDGGGPEVNQEVQEVEYYEIMKLNLMMTQYV